MGTADPRKLRDEAQAAMARGKHSRALEAYQALARIEPDDGAWPHRAGELQHRLGQRAAALETLRQAVATYARAGFLLKAVGVCKLILRIDPDADDARARLVELNRERGIAVVARPVVPAPAPAPPAAGAVPLDLDVIHAPGLDEAARAALASSALVAALDGPRIGWLIDRSRLVELAAGEVLFRQGQPGDALYVVIGGEVAVLAEGPPRQELGRLGEGAFFGEIALLTDEERTATVEAVGRAEVLELGRAVVEELCAAEPSVLGVILSAVRERLVGRLADGSALFRPYLGRDRRELVARFRCLDAAAGQVLVTQGERADGLHVLLGGRAEVVRGGEAGEQAARIAVLRPGDLFGEMSLLTGQPAVATVRATTRVLVLHLPAADFREVIMTHPQVLAAVGDVADERRARLEGAPGHLDLL